jgi:hypothetical protein
MDGSLPCITVFPRGDGFAHNPQDPLAAFATLLALGQKEGHDGLRDMTGRIMATLATEGRSFRTTPEGTRWLQVIEHSGLAQNGWMLWNMLDIDRLIAESDPLGDRPSDMIADLIAHLGQTSLADLVTLVSDLSLESWRHASQ